MCPNFIDANGTCLDECVPNIYNFSIKMCLPDVFFCPAFVVLGNATYCIDECKGLFIVDLSQSEGKQCISSCPPNLAYNSNNECVASCTMHVYDSVSLTCYTSASQCPIFYIYNTTTASMVCISSCPA